MGNRVVAAGQPVLIAQQLGFSYGGKPIFSDVDLRIEQGEILCLIGASGCGKSTLLRLLAGLAEPEAGKITGTEGGQKERIARGSVVFQSPALLPWLTVAQNAGFGLDFACRVPESRAQRQERVAHILAQVGLAGEGGKYPSALSGGMAQRVALARALVRDPEIIYLDEPFSALDAITRESMQDALVALAHEHRSAAFLVTHDIDEALRIGDRVMLLAGSPARIAGEWRPGGSLPRQHRSPALNAIREEILHALSNRAPVWYPTL